MTVKVLLTGGTMLYNRSNQSTEGGHSYFEEMGFCDVPVIHGLSEDFNQETWENLSKKIYKELDDCDELLVAHGTDTMIYSASALSFALCESNKQIIFTGSQKPLAKTDSDGFLNLQASKLVLEKGNFGGTFIVSQKDPYSAYIHKGTRAKKISSISNHTFSSNPLFGSVDVTRGKVKVYSKDHKSKGSQLGRLYPAFNEQVVLIKSFPKLEVVLEGLSDRKISGLVVEGYGLGNISFEATELLKSISSELPVVVTSQCEYSHASYPNSLELERAGVIFAKDMISEIAYVKLSWIIGNFGVEYVGDLFLSPISGEINVT